MTTTRLASNLLAAVLLSVVGSAYAAPPLSNQHSTDTDSYLNLNSCENTQVGFSCVFFSVLDAFSSAGVYRYSVIDFLEFDSVAGTARSFNCSRESLIYLLAL